MGEYIFQEMYDYFRLRGYSKKQSARIAMQYIDSVVEALEVQLDVELSHVYDNVKQGEEEDGDTE